MKYNSDIHHRRSIRLQGYDYRREGSYFVTLCTVRKQCLLGEIHNGQMHLSAFGQIAAETWQWLEIHHPYIALDEWIVMPNHLHGIVWITPHHDVPRRDGS
jgi:REP element-mobilizing transposase RayT